MCDKEFKELVKITRSMCLTHQNDDFPEYRVIASGQLLTNNLFTLPDAPACSAPSRF